MEKCPNQTKSVRTYYIPYDQPNLMKNKRNRVVGNKSCFVYSVFFNTNEIKVLLIGLDMDG